MDQKELKQFVLGTSKKSGSMPDGDKETAQIRVCPPYSRKDLMISQQVMKNMCTSITCDVCGEPAEVRCNCCKLLFCSTLCLLKSEPKHKIVCETSSQVFTSEDNLEYLNISSEDKVDVSGPNAPSQPAVEEKKAPLQTLQSVINKRISSNLETVSNECPKSRGQFSTLIPPSKFLGNRPLDSSQQEKKAVQPPAQAEVKKSPTTPQPINLPYVTPIPAFPENFKPLTKTSTIFPGARKVTSPLTPPPTPNASPNIPSVPKEPKTSESSPQKLMVPLPTAMPEPSPQKLMVPLPTAMSEPKPQQLMEPLTTAMPEPSPQKLMVPLPSAMPEPSPQKLMAPLPTAMPWGNKTQLWQTLMAHQVEDHPSLEIYLNQFTPAQIVTTESKDIYWVLDLESYDKTFIFDEEIRKFGEPLIISRPTLNLWCSVIHDSDWYRAVITGLSPLTAYLMDIGIEKTVTDAYELPDTLKEDPPLAVRVWAKDAPTELLNLPISTAVMIRGVGQFSGGIIVEIKLQFSGGTDVIASVKNDLKSYKNHVLDEIYARNLPFCVRINKTVGNSGLIGSIILDIKQEELPCYTDCDSMLLSLSHSTPNPKLSPKINDLVSAKLGDLWYRGLVCQKSQDDIKVALIDYGLIVEPNAICALPEKLHGQYATAVRLNFKEELENILNLTGDHLTGSLSRNGQITFEIGTADIDVWDAKPEDFPESVFPYYSGMSVIIVSFSSTTSIYVQPADCPEMYTFLEVVDTESKSAPEIARKLFCGEMVACWFEGIFYRAKILNQVGTSYQVLFVDYGDTQVIPIKQMRDLNDRFKTVPYYAIKVGLAQLAELDFSPPAHNLMEHYVSQSIRFKLEIESPLDAVHLITPDEETLNSMLIETLVLHTNFIFKHKNLIYEQFRPGQEIEMAPMQIAENNNVYAVNMESSVMKLLKNFTEQLTLYCSDYQGPYKPSLNDVVAAKYEDGRSYRAICVQINEDSCEVFFVDYGNYAIVTFQDVCPIGGEFMSHPVPVKECIIYGMSVFSPDEKREIITNLIGKVENAFVINDVNNQAMVYMPSINEILRYYKKPEIVAPPMCKF